MGASIRHPDIYALFAQFGWLPLVTLLFLILQFVFLALPTAKNPEEFSVEPEFSDFSGVVTHC